MFLPPLPTRSGLKRVGIVTFVVTPRHVDGHVWLTRGAGALRSAAEM
jgi:hypothetical protein